MVGIVGGVYRIGGGTIIVPFLVTFFGLSIPWPRTRSWAPF